MKMRMIILLACLALLNDGATVEATAPGILDVKEAVLRACAYSPELAALRARVESARMARREKWREFLPSASLQYVQDETVNTGAPDERSRQVLVTLGYDIHTGGTTVDEYEVAGFEHLMAHERFRTERAALVLAVKKEYYALQGAAGDVEVQRSLLESLSLQRRIIDEEARQGMATELQRVQADARIAEAGYELSRAENAWRAGLMNMKMRIGSPPDETLAIAPLHDTGGKDPMDAGAKDALTVRALRCRPEMRQSIYALRAARAADRIAGRYFLPVVRLSGSYGYRGERFPMDGRVWSVGVSVTSAIFGSSVADSHGWGEGDYGAQRSASHAVQADLWNDPSYARRAQEAASALGEAAREMERTRARIVMEVERALDRAGETSGQVRLARTNADLLERQAAIEDMRARLGELARYEVLKTYIELARARLRVQSSLAENLSASAELEVALGGDSGGAL
jgi:outer membrane protein TolC